MAGAIGMGEVEGRKAGRQREVVGPGDGIEDSTKGITRRGTSTKGNAKRGIKESNTGGRWERRQRGQLAWASGVCAPG